MHIDHAKLVEILVEASGIEKEKVESQLSEFVQEITEALEEGDAYELEGFGVFSGIGNNVIFIPSDELATEINYKYVGMEPIEMDEPSEKAMSQEEAPAQDQEAELEEEDPFAGLLDEDEDEIPQEARASFELDVEDDDDDVKQAEEEKEPADIEDFADEDAEEAPFDLADEELEEGAEEIPEKPGPEKWGIDTYKDDSAENMFSGLLGDKGEGGQSAEDESEEDLKPLFNDADESDDDNLSSEIGKQLSEDVEEEASLNETFNADEGTKKTSEGISEDENSYPEEEEDFDDDPFKSLAEESNEEEDRRDEASSKKEKEAKDEDIVPVIKNLASKSSKKKEKESKKEDPRPVFSNNKAAKKSKSQPVMLWIILIILLLGGATYGLGYYGFINIPGVTPYSQTQIARSTTPATPPPTEPQQPEQQTTQPEATTEQQSSQPQTATPEPEQENVVPEEQEAQSQVSQNEVPPNQPTYGLNGVPVPEANDGYTIVIYSLTKESNAEAVRNELSNAGYRVLIAEIPSRQYGTLWRVSLGQFNSTSDAVLAVENIDASYTENYFITKIQ
ncbi:MAG: SPOR domain-containing protein [Gracilimonas sp.]|uniref:SPOR domain-containing protein n=1 Tax=Gracilimonas sp. TaxID=1974203 RepID=UPI00198E7451|nr:SPOR domain-containing protein [Gracilimonas sp.]MBD3617205.1 SPOR domain-containing protein [Gracilimonas sp.]